MDEGGFAIWPLTKKKRPQTPYHIGAVHGIMGRKCKDNNWRRAKVSIEWWRVDPHSCWWLRWTISNIARLQGHNLQMTDFRWSCSNVALNANLKRRRGRPWACGNKTKIRFLINMLNIWKFESSQEHSLPKRPLKASPSDCEKLKLFLTSAALKSWPR